MGWGYGHDEDGREIGYLVDAECDQEGCDKQINRGLAYRCGEITEDTGCGLHFCESHLFFSLKLNCQVCQSCLEENPDDDEEDGD